MGKDSKVGWTHHTFNGWWGCVEVSEACRRCYAKTWAKRTGWDVWGHGSPRRFFGEAHWREPLAWDRAAAEAGERHRVFAFSMGDWAEDHEELDPWRAKLWDLIRATPNLDWLLLTKRANRIARLLPEGWGDGWPNVWMGVTCESPDELWRVDDLVATVPAVVRFVSYEPAIAPVDFRPWLRCPGIHLGGVGIEGEWSGCRFGSRMDTLGLPGSDCPTCMGRGRGLDWIIVGGESGAGARRMDHRWASSVLEETRRTNTAVFVKQLGEAWARDWCWGGKLVSAWGDPKGEDPTYWPQNLRVREFPTPRVM